MDNRDRARFVHDMFEFNDTKPATNVWHRFKKTMPDKGEDVRGKDVRHPYIERERIIDIHGWCLMRNHYHLLISPRVEGGLTSFMRKLNTGYTNYFNERYKRSGVLFQGKTKRKLIDDNAYFLHILHYIHLNPLDMRKETRTWREFKIKGVAAALDHLASYRWSSYRDYCGIKNFPSILTTHLFADVFGDYTKTITRYLKDIDEETVATVTLE